MQPKKTEIPAHPYNAGKKADGKETLNKSQNNNKETNTKAVIYCCQSHKEGWKGHPSTANYFDQ